MAFKGTAITQGAGEGIVVATGMDTEIGRISDLAQSAEAEVAPLERRLDRLGHRLVWLTLALAALTIGAGILRGSRWRSMIQTGVALAVAAVPEGLPVVATLSLARGMWRMSARNALITQLSSVETLGATTVILTDKTGTLTENRMTAVRYLLDDGEVEVDDG
jgi:P-type Ca2+ transporter type 2C